MADTDTFKFTEFSGKTSKFVGAVYSSEDDDEHETAIPTTEPAAGSSVSMKEGKISIDGKALPVHPSQCDVKGLTPDKVHLIFVIQNGQEAVSHDTLIQISHCASVTVLGNLKGTVHVQNTNTKDTKVAVAGGAHSVTVDHGNLNVYGSVQGHVFLSHGSLMAPILRDTFIDKGNDGRIFSLPQGTDISAELKAADEREATYQMITTARMKEIFLRELPPRPPKRPPPPPPLPPRSNVKIEEIKAPSPDSSSSDSDDSDSDKKRHRPHRTVPKPAIASSADHKYAPPPPSTSSSSSSTSSSTARPKPMKPFDVDKILHPRPRGRKLPVFKHPKSAPPRPPPRPPAAAKDGDEGGGKGAPPKKRRRIIVDDPVEDDNMDFYGGIGKDSE